MSDRRIQYFLPIIPNPEANHSQSITGDAYTHLLCSLSHCKDRKGYIVSIQPCARNGNGYKVMITGSSEDNHRGMIASAARFNAKEFAALKDKVMEFTDDPNNPAIAKILKCIGYTYPSTETITTTSPALPALPAPTTSEPPTSEPTNIIPFPSTPLITSPPLTTRFPFKKSCLSSV